MTYVSMAPVDVVECDISSWSVILEAVRLLNFIDGDETWNAHPDYGHHEFYITCSDRGEYESYGPWGVYDIEHELRSNKTANDVASDIVREVMEHAIS